MGGCALYWMRTRYGTAFGGITEKVLENNKTPAVIDADGLNLLAKTDEWGIEQIRMNPSGYVLTPHMKECPD